MQFNFTYQTSADGSSNVSPEQMKTFEMAGRIWAKYLKDDVTINIHVGTNDQLPDNVVGGALPGMLGASDYGSYSNFINGLNSDSTSSDDQISTDTLKHGTMVNGLNLWRQQTYLTTANGKALDLPSVNAAALDGVILMSDLSNLAWNQDTNSSNDIGWRYYGSSPATPHTLDFLSVALHEIGHILGFTSGVDDSDWFQKVVNTQTQIDGGTLNSRIQETDGSEITYVEGDYSFGFTSRKMPLDFFRYTETSEYWNLTDLSTGEDAYFSVDGGATNLANLSTSKYGDGDGYQASHWENTAISLGIMAPALRLNQSNTISILDLRAFDVIGWNLANSLLGSDGTPSQAELEQTFDLANTQSLNALWQSASTYIDQNQNGMTGDRFNDVLQMINSDFYEGKRRRRRESSSWQELWQEITDVFNTEARFSTFDASIESTLATHNNGFIPREQVLGSQNDDALVGNESQDKLVGKQGQDVLHGYGNDDLLRGGQHRDVLVGGAGSDIFVVQDKKGFDVVRDFTDGEDLLKLSGDLIFDQIAISQKNDHTLLKQDDTLLMVLRNVDAETLTIADFV